MKTLLAAAFLLAPATQPAPPAPPPCLTRAEVTDLTLFLLPALLDGVAEQCRPSLAAGAYLLTGGRSLSQRLTADMSHGPGALAAVRKIGGADKLPPSLSADTLRGLARDMLGKEMLKGVKPAQCGAINEAAELLAPLPPENLGRLIAVALSAGARPGHSGSGPRVCPAEAR